MMSDMFWWILFCAVMAGLVSLADSFFDLGLYAF